jgi:3-phenylpropionate/cinnamic acid dioxygenase small subunit
MAGSPGVRGAAVGDLMRRKVATHDGSPRTKHVTTNAIIEFIDAGTATCRSYYTVLQATDSMPLQTIITGRYHDRFERIDDTWHLADRAVFIEQVGDMSQHVRLPRT